jgi:hypothetical protein
VIEEGERVFGQDGRTSAERLEYLASSFSADQFAPLQKDVLKAGSRSLGVASTVLAGIQDDRGRVSAVAKPVRLIAPPILAFARASLHLGTYAAVIVLLAVAGALIGCGAAYDVAPLARIGWTAVLYLTVILLSLWAVRKLIADKLNLRPVPPGSSPKRRRRHIPRKLFAALVTLLLIIFPLALLNSAVAVLVDWLPGWS